MTGGVYDNEWLLEGDLRSSAPWMTVDSAVYRFGSVQDLNGRITGNINERGDVYIEFVESKATITGVGSSQSESFSIEGIANIYKQPIAQVSFHGIC